MHGISYREREREVIGIEQQLLNTHQHTIEGARIAAALHVTQHGDARVLVDFLDHRGAHHFRTDRIALAIDRSLRYDDDVETLAGVAFLRGGGNADGGVTAVTNSRRKNCSDYYQLGDACEMRLTGWLRSEEIMIEKAVSGNDTGNIFDGIDSHAR